MLSRPPASFAAAISSRPACVERAGALEDRRHARLRDHRGEAVRADHEHVAVAGLIAPDVDLHVGLGAERAGDDRALGMRLGLLLGQLAAGHQLAHQRVVAGEALEPAVAQQVGARVADVRDRDLLLADVGGGHRGAHAGALGLGARAVVDAAVGVLDHLHERRRPASRPAARGRTTRPPSPTPPRRPGRRPCRRRRRTAARGRSSCPRCPDAAGRGRTRGSVRICAASALEGELAVPDADAVTDVERLRASERLPVEVGAVGRAEVLEHDHVSLRHQPRMGGRRERVLEPDVGRVAAPEQRAVREVVGRSGAQPGRASPPAASACRWARR